VVQVQWSIGLNPYSVYTECYGGAPSANWIYSETENEAVVMMPEGLRIGKEELKARQQFIQELAQTKNVTIRIPCSYTDDRETYLNRPDVRAALHVPDTVQYWLPCGNIVYDQTYNDVRAEYAKVLSRGYHILGYYGDWDMACDHLSGMWFFESLGVPMETPFKEWFYPDSLGYNQIAGFVIQWENMKYVSVKGAGHFVPTDQSLSAYMMYEKFLNNEPY
jgi:cathepsin A (carboxypeptidase C)